MLAFKAELHQIQFPDPTGGASSTPPDLSFGFKLGLVYTFKGKEWMKKKDTQSELNPG